MTFYTTFDFQMFQTDTLEQLKHEKREIHIARNAAQSYRRVHVFKCQS